MSAPTVTPDQQEHLRQEWLDAIAREVDKVRGWAESRGWQTSSSTREINEQVLGRYHAPVLIIDTDAGRLHFEPIGRGVLGGNTGRIDLYAWPTLYRVMLLRRQDGSWVVRTESGINWPHEWGRETFLELAEGLVNAL